MHTPWHRIINTQLTSITRGLTLTGVDRQHKHKNETKTHELDWEKCPSYNEVVSPNIAMSMVDFCKHLRKLTLVHSTK